MIALLQPHALSTTAEAREGVTRALGPTMAAVLADEPVLVNGAAAAAGSGKGAKQVGQINHQRSLAVLRNRLSSHKYFTLHSTLCVCCIRYSKHKQQCKLSVPSVWLPAQDFLRVYETLRDELVADPLTDGQPQFAADHLKRVGVPAHEQRLVLACFTCVGYKQCTAVRRCWTTTSLEGN